MLGSEIVMTGPLVFDRAGGRAGGLWSCGDGASIEDDVVQCAGVLVAGVFAADAEDLQIRENALHLFLGGRRAAC